MMTVKPFFVIGSPKCGTTSLASLLRQHPNLLVSQPKENNFFIDQYNNGLEFYFKKYFPSLDDKRHIYFVDMSILNMVMADVTAARIYKEFPDARLLAILRNPLERALSDYNAAIRTGREGEDFVKTFYKEEKRKKQNRYPYKAQLYFTRGLYYQQLRCFFSYYDKNKIRIFKYEDFFADLAHSLTKIQEFLEIDENFDFDLNVYRNKAEYTVRYKKLNYLLFGRNELKSRFKKIFPGKLKNTIKKNLQKFNKKKDIKNRKEARNKLNKKFIEDIYSFYENDLMQLEKEYKVNTRDWLEAIRNYGQ